MSNKMVLGDDPSCGVWFVSATDPSIEVRASRLANNERSCITGICPNTASQYNKIVIRTQYSGSLTNHLKTVRVIESDFVIERI